MPIDPILTSTVQVKELPPNPISLTDNFPHEVGDILSRATIAELVSFLQSQTSAQQYELKTIRVPSYGYITTNFDMTVGANQGIGKVDGLWSGWAICNGNNGTDNIDGRGLIGYGANNPTVGQFIGSADSVVVSHSHYNGVANELTSTFVYGGVTNDMPGSSAFTVAEDGGARTYQGNTSTSGVSGVGKNIPPSMVILIIMKL